MRALQLVSYMERRSAVLPSADVRGAFAGGGRVIFRSDVAAADESELVTIAPPLTADPLFLRSVATFRRTPSTFPKPSLTSSDVVVISRIRTARRRLRAFYLTPRLMTATVHERLIPGRPGQLELAARIMGRMRGASDLVVPELLEAGSGPRAEWIVEEMLLGAHPLPDQHTAVARAVGHALLSAHESTGVRRWSLRRYLTQGLSEAVAELAALPEMSGGRHDPDKMRTRAERLVNSNRDLVVGHCHGDPVLGNTLILPDGRLGLLDWEYAAERPLAHDVVKACVGNHIDERVIDEVAESLRRYEEASTMPARHQLAFALMALLRDWKGQRRRAHRSNRTGSHDKVLRRRLSALARLLDDL